MVALPSFFTIPSCCRVDWPAVSVIATGLLKHARQNKLFVTVTLVALASFAASVPTFLGGIGLVFIFPTVAVSSSLASLTLLITGILFGAMAFYLTNKDSHDIYRMYQ